jgi:type VI secretion system protein ImpC
VTDATTALEPASERKLLVADEERPFRILVLGDFSARNHRAVFEPGQLGWRIPLPLDLETLEGTMSRLAPSLNLPVPGTPRRRITLRFRDFNDFLPEAVLNAVSQLDPPLAGEEQAAAIRALLHHPDFQDLEASWRSLFQLMQRAGTGANLRVYLMDVTKQEFADDLCTAYDVSDCGIYRLLVTQSSIRAAHPWSVCLGNYSFSPYVEDIETLSRIARVARHAGTAFVAGVRHDWPGEPGLAWQMLRECPEASYVGLATPRYLVRLPYLAEEGAAFPFDEMPEEPALEDYLWGNPAFVCAAFLVNEFSREGWHMEPGEWLELDGFNSHEFSVHGEARCTPPTESEFADAELQGLLDRGVIPLVPAPTGTAIRLPRLQSVRRPATPLRGQW